MINRYYKYSEYSGKETIDVDGNTINIKNRDDVPWE